MLRTRIWRFLAPLALAVAGLIGMNIQPAGAYIVANYNWIAGRSMWDAYTGAYPACSVGLHMGSNTGNHVVIMPDHCFNNYPGGFASRFENADYFDGAQVARPGGGYTGFDIAAVVTGPISNATPKSNQVWDYCNPSASWNCSSAQGGGSNANWVGTARTVAGYVTGLSVGTTVCKSGFKSGTSCGQVAGSYSNWVYDENGVGLYVSGYIVTGLGNCASSPGDSGAIVYQPAANGTVYVAGILNAGIGTTYTAGPGNGCFAEGTKYRTGFAFTSIAVIQAAFAASGLYVYY